MNLKGLLIFIFSCLLSNSLCWANQAVKAYQNGLVLKEYKSIVVIEDKSGNKLIPSIGLSLKPGARVRTGPDSTALLHSDKGDTYFLEENSELLISLPLSQKFKKLQLAKNAKGGQQKSTMEFLKGRIQTHIKPGQKDQVKIKTAVSVLSIKGTTFTVSIENQLVTLDVLDGIVEMENNIGEVINVVAGMRANTKSWKIEKLPKIRRDKMDNIQQNNQKNIKTPSPTNKNLRVNLVQPQNSPERSLEYPTTHVERPDFDDHDLDLVSPHHVGKRPHEHKHDRHDDDHHYRDPTKRNPNGIKITGKPPTTPTK